jgi:outer membrane lipase/esterase
MKRLIRPLAAVCLLAGISPALLAAPFSGFYVFGDSLSDSGQFPDIDLSSFPGDLGDQGGPPGATLRFTNRVGPTYQGGQGEIFAPVATMILSDRLGLGPLTGSTRLKSDLTPDLPNGNNYAVGGNTTAQIFDSITGSGEGSVVELPDGTNLRVRDAFLPDLAKRGLALDASALYYVNGGGNDFLDGIIVNVPSAQASADRLADSVRALQVAGARYIVVPLLGSFSQTPLVTSFNQHLLAQLAGIDAEIIPLNAPLLGREVLENPAAFGLDGSQNLTGTCFRRCDNINPTWGINSATPDPSKLLFDDRVHPTAAMQQISGDYAYSLLSAPQELTLLPEMAMGNLQAHQDQLRNQWRADWSAWQAVEQWRGFVLSGGQRQDYAHQDNAQSGDGNGYSLNLGGSYRLDSAWRLGSALGFYEQKLEVGSAHSDYKANSYLATAFAQYEQDRWWADASVSVGSLDYDKLQRSFTLGQVKRTEMGDTSGNLWGASARIGYDIAQGDSDWHLSPFLSADYAQVNVDGYAEDGGRSTALTYADQQRDSRRLGVGIQGRYQLSSATAVFAEYSHEREYEDDTSTLRSQLNSLPGISFELQGYTPGDSLDSGTVGVSHLLSKDLSLRGGYSYSKAQEQTLQGLSLSLALDW